MNATITEINKFGVIFFTTDEGERGKVGRSGLHMTIDEGLLEVGDRAEVSKWCMTNAEWTWVMNATFRTEVL